MGGLHISDFTASPQWNLTFSRSWDSDSASRSSVSSITRARVSLRRALAGYISHCSSEGHSDSNGFFCGSQSGNPTFLCCSGSTASPGDTGLKEERNSISFTVQSPKSQLRCQQKTEELAFPAGGRWGQEIRSGAARGQSESCSHSALRWVGDGASQRLEGFQIKSIPFKSLANFVCNSFRLEWNSNKWRHPGVRPGGAVKVTLPASQRD